MIYLDLTIFSIQKVGGISVVWSEYISRLKRVCVDQEFRLLLPDSLNIIGKSLDLSSFDVQIIKSRGAISKYLPCSLIGTKNDVLHTSYYQWYPFFKGTKIVTLHDFMHEKYAPLTSRIFHNILKYISLRSADIVICISETTRNDFKEIYPDLYSKKVIKVVENAASDYFAPSNKYVHGSNLLWVGGRSGYKNFEMAMRLLSYLHTHDLIYTLNVVGPALTRDEMKLAESLGVLQQINVITEITQEELRDCYCKSLALLYLSKYEGFGLPIIEAQKCKCPVIALKNPASLEVGRDSVLYFDENSQNHILDILKLIEDKSRREKIIDNGLKNSNRYSWDISVSKLCQIYRACQ